MKNTNSYKSEDDLREYEKFDVAYKMSNVEIAKYKVECKNNNIVYNTQSTTKKYQVWILAAINVIV